MKCTKHKRGNNQFALAEHGSKSSGTKLSNYVEDAIDTDIHTELEAFPLEAGIEK